MKQINFRLIGPKLSILSMQSVQVQQSLAEYYLILWKNLPEYFIGTLLPPLKMYFYFKQLSNSLSANLFFPQGEDGEAGDPGPAGEPGAPVSLRTLNHL